MSTDEEKERSRRRYDFTELCYWDWCMKFFSHDTWKQVKDS